MTTTSNWFDIEPVPASRPRFRAIPNKKGGSFVTTYYAGKYKTFLADAEKAIPRAETTHEGNLEVSVICVVTKPKTTKRANPNGDVDNYAKGVLDTLTKKGYWHDDMQITDLRVQKRWADPATVYPDPGFSVVITEVE